MNIFIATLFPSLYENFLATSLVKRAIEKNIFHVSLFNMFDTVLPGKRIDSPIVGHGAGMLLGAPIIEKTVESATSKNNGKKPFTIFFSPHGKKLDQTILKNLASKIQEQGNNMLLVSGRYEGFDARAEEVYADEIISIGDYVLCGGDLPIMVFIEGFIRLLKGVVGNQDSVDSDSFSEALLDCPHYTAPDIWQNKKIPAILKSGNHASIKEWRENQSIERTILTNWDWLRKKKISFSLKKKIKKIIPNHYCALLHNDIMLKDGTVGNSTITSIDIHDIARSSKTYGIKEYFVVTRLEAQFSIAEHFLHFWKDKEAIALHQSRAEAIATVSARKEINDCIEYIKKIEGVSPLVIVTSSRREIPHDRMITFFDQGKIWAQKRPILFIFGTSHGISPAVMNACDYRLTPLEGLEEFNFLSVRSAVGIVLDRWLGFNYCH
jgi:tRNA (guanine37-N1)-methyltransferase